jgi:23S rRNA (cytidine1920-2'-O)/16S rRNA (cytidine1409-2'-O)-methyltransferase
MDSGCARLDIALALRGLAKSRSEAQAAIVSGCVSVNAVIRRKPSFKVATADQIEFLAVHPYAGRGGVKLSAGLQEFGIDPSGWRCLDVGASTGGFTDCLLKRGAEHVTAVDVGSGQMIERLARDPRVTLIENVNARNLRPADFDELFDLAVVDVSFISLTLLMPRLATLIKPEHGRMIALIKPQFEVGRDALGAGGIVRDEALRMRAVETVIASAAAAALACLGRMDSPIAGGDGNKEFLALFAHKPDEGAR